MHDNIPDGYTLCAVSGAPVPAVVAFDAIPEPPTHMLDGQQVTLVGYVLDVTGDWHPVIFRPGAFVPETLFRSR
jgi:hypothetical protein